MKVAVIGSRSLQVNDLEKYLPEGTEEIVSGGACGIDVCAREYAVRKRISLTEFLPAYERYGRAAPLKRNEQIVDYSDLIPAFWDGRSRGTNHVIEPCRKRGKEVKVFI